MSNSLIIDTTSAVSRRRMVKLVAGDTTPLPVQFVGLDLTTYTTAEAHLKYEDRSRKTYTLTVVDEENCTVDWETDDLIPGSHQLEFELTVGGNNITYPQDYAVIISVRDDLA